MLTARSATALAAGALAWYLHALWLPWPPSGTVPLLDLVQLRNPSAYALFRAWWWLAPLAAGSLLAAAALNAWQLWGPAARRRSRDRSSLPPDPFRADAPAISLTVGELHHPVEPRETASPAWLALPERGLYTGICVVGAVGAGKTSACLHPFARQLLGWQAADSERRAAALVLEVKGDFCHEVHSILAACGREGDYRELALDGEWAWNPLHEPLVDSYSLAHSIGSLLNQLFGKGKDPFWQQAYTSVVRNAIELCRLAPEPWFTLQDVYRLAIAPGGFGERLRAGPPPPPPSGPASGRKSSPGISTNSPPGSGPRPPTGASRARPARPTSRSWNGSWDAARNASARPRPRRRTAPRIRKSAAACGCGWRPCGAGTATTGSGSTPSCARRWWRASPRS